MTKAKMLIIMMLICAITIVFPNIVKAETTTETITYEKIVTSTNGSVEFLIKGLKLEEGASYQWAIEKSKDAQITNWYDVLAPEYTTGNIKITLLVDNKNQLEILKSTDTAYITVRKVGETINLLENYNVDLSLPLLKDFSINKSSSYRSAPDNEAYNINTIYGINASNVSFKWEKITDADIVNNYIDNNHDLSGLNLKGKEGFPSLSDTSWKSVHQKGFPYSEELGVIYNKEVPTEDGLYYLWLKGSSSDVKTLYGQAVLEVGEVTKINTTPNNNNSNNSNNNNNQNQQTPGSSNNQNNNQNNQGQQANQNNNNQKQDNTTATGTLPKAGLTVGTTTTLIVVLGIAIFGFYKYNKLKDIK